MESPSRAQGIAAGDRVDRPCLQERTSKAQGKRLQREGLRELRDGSCRTSAVLQASPGKCIPFGSIPGH